jgi:hypothetical protein
MVAGEADARADALVTDFICHVLESWLLAQHTYWSIGRGLPMRKHAENPSSV